MKNKGIVHSFTPRVSGALMALALLPIVSQADVLTFNDTAQITSEFNLIGSGGLVASTGNGLSGSNCVTAPNSTSSVGRYYNQGSIPTRTSFDVGVYFYWTTPTDTNVANIVIGVAGASTLGSGEGLNYTMSRTNVTTGNMYGFRAQLEKLTGTTTYKIRVANVVDATSGGTWSEGSYNITFTNGNWYFLKLEGVYDSSDEKYNLTVNVYNSDSSGTIGNLVTNGTRSVSDWLNNDVLTDPDSSLVPFFGAHGAMSRTGLGRYDSLIYNPGMMGYAPLSMGISGINYYSAPLFANAIMHEQRNWMDSVSKAQIYRQNTDGTPNPQISSLGYPNYLNSGQVLELWPGQNGGSQNNTHLTGQVVLQWQGSADFRLTSGTFNAAKSNTGSTGLATNGKRVYTISGTPNGLVVRLYAIGTPAITSLKLWMPNPADPVNTSLEGVLFHPSRLSLFTDREWGSLRFMDLGATNGNPQKDWVDRRMPADCFGVGVINRRAPASGATTNRITGISYEHMIMLSNETERDMWLCVPHMATDTYMDNLCNLIAYGSDGTNPYTSPQTSPVYPPLDSNLKVYFEYSNEIWSSGGNFPQGDWAQAQATLLGITKPQFNARQFSKLWQKLEARIGASRVERVAAVWTAQSTYTTPFIDEFYNNPSLLQPEIISPTTYYGHGIQWWVYHHIPNLPGLITDPYWTSQQFEDDLASAFDQWEFFAINRITYSSSGSTGPDSTIGLSDYIRNIALARDLTVIAYEGGASLYTDAIDLGGSADDGITHFVNEMNRRQPFGTIYDIVINQAFERGLRSHSMFTDVGSWSKYGQWGHLEYLTQNRDTSPKWSTARMMFDELETFTHIDDPVMGTRPSFTTDAALPLSDVGIFYSQTIQTSGGEGNLTFDLLGLHLVAGLNFNIDTLTVSGTPSESGVNTIYLRVFDGDGDVAWRTFSFRIQQRSTAPEVTINFEQFATQSNLVEPFIVGDYKFTSNIGSNRLNIHGIADGPYPRGWPSKVLMGNTWPTTIFLQRVDGTPFDLAAFDIGGNAASSVKVTVTYPDDTTQTIICNFPQNQLNPMTRHTPDIVGAKKISFLFYELSNATGTARVGDIDNLLINDAPSAPVKQWEFATTTEGWYAQNHISPFAWQTGGYVGGTFTGIDPYARSGDNLNTSIANHKTIQVRMKASGGTTGKFYFTTTTNTTWDGAKSKEFVINGDNNWYVYQVDMSTVGAWTGTLKQLRLDPNSVGVIGTTFSVDYIRIIE